jgi:hypothetical protein
MFLNLVLGPPPLPRGVPGEGPDCHFPKEIVGFGPIPARIRGFLIFIVALSTARSTRVIFGLCCVLWGRGVLGGLCRPSSPDPLAYSRRFGRRAQGQNWCPAGTLALRGGFGLGQWAVVRLGSPRPNPDKFQTNPRQIPDKFQTNSRQIPESGKVWKILENSRPLIFQNFPDFSRLWNLSGI